MNNQVEQPASVRKQGYRWDPSNPGRRYNYGAPLGAGQSGRKLRGAMLLGIAGKLEYLSAGFLAFLAIGSFASGGTLTTVMGRKFTEEGTHSSLYIFVGLFSLLLAAGHFVLGRLATKWRNEPDRAFKLLLYGAILLGLSLLFGLSTRDLGAIALLSFGPGLYFAGGLLNHLQVSQGDGVD
ncbi:MAG: hypothetical protein QM296_07245 [Bacillota bacterium]|nr:hypothetical protein [Bacillota bacterium]